MSTRIEHCGPPLPLSAQRAASRPAQPAATATSPRSPWRTQGKLALRVLGQRLGLDLPLSATIFATDRCNVRCDGCLFYESLHADGSARAEDTATMLRILDALRANGVPFVSWAGGEPFLRKDLPELLRAGHDRGFAQSVITNAMVAAPRVVEACEEICESVVFSPHPPEEIRGGSGERRWLAAWNGFAALRDRLRRAQLVVAITLGKHTASRLDEILTRAFDGGADRIRFQSTFYRSQFPSAEEIAEMHATLQRWSRREPGRIDIRDPFVDELASFFADTPRVGCTAHRKFNVGIHLDGSVSACCPERVIIGNILKTPLSRMHTRPEQIRTDCFGCHRTEIFVFERYCGHRSSPTALR